MGKKIKAGEWVEVLSPREILATLDQEGALDGVPFQPEMLTYCGQRFRVSATAHRTCDSLYWGAGRDIPDAVYLDEPRCSGAAHGGCQAGCLLLWKDAWLKRVDGANGSAAAAKMTDPVVDVAWLNDKTVVAQPGTEKRYRCQATEHVNASRPVPGFMLGSYLRDVVSRNSSPGSLLRDYILMCIWRLRFLGVGWRFAVGLYGKFHWFIYRQPDPYVEGKIPLGTPTPSPSLNLEVGEWVRIKDLREIAATLSVENKTRGLKYTPDVAVYCGQKGRVTARITRIIDEKTGRMLNFNNPCIAIENAYCLGRYVPEALHCPRRGLIYYREAWLERTQPDETGEKK